MGGSPAQVSKPDLLVLTVGHSTRSLEEFFELLRAHEVQTIVDVRTVPKSRRNPQFNKDSLAVTGPEAGFLYVHVPELGGLRHASKQSINTGWRNLSFRGYADYMQTDAFAEAVEALKAAAAQSRQALMCAEAVHWRCHRSLIADALLVRGVQVEHISTPRKRLLHRLTPFAKVEVVRVPGNDDSPAPHGITRKRITYPEIIETTSQPNVAKAA